MNSNTATAVSNLVAFTIVLTMLMGFLFDINRSKCNNHYV